MKQDSRTFISPHGTLIVSNDGIKIKRTWAQALQSGRLVPREQTIPFSTLEKVNRQRGRGGTEYLQLISKTGAPKVTPLNRKVHLKYGARESHNFRQAERVIEDRLKQQLELLHGGPEQRGVNHTQPETPDSPTKSQFSGLPFRR